MRLTSPLTLFLLTAASVSVWAGSGFADTPPPPRASEYSDKIDECLNAKPTAAKSIGRTGEKWEFHCPSSKAWSSDYAKAYQVVFSAMAHKLDIESEKAIKALRSDGDKPTSQILGEKISRLFDTVGPGTQDPKNLAVQYLQLCQGAVLREVVKHFGKVQTDQPVLEFVNSLKGESVCKVVIDQKIMAYRQSAYVVYGMAQSEKYREDKQDFVSKTKDAYEQLLWKLTILSGKFDTIKDKQPSKLKNVMQGLGGMISDMFGGGG